jgi:hypothetical protein
MVSTSGAIVRGPILQYRCRSVGNGVHLCRTHAKSSFPARRKRNRSVDSNLQSSWDTNRRGMARMLSLYHGVLHLIYRLHLHDDRDILH